MNKVLFLENEGQISDFCSEQKYYDFLDYAFSKTDYFMLVYVNYYGKGYTKYQKYFKNALSSYKVKARTNPSWPGTLRTACSDTSYKIVFYKTTEEAKNILKEVSHISAWTRGYPEDLAFFIGNKCWFYSVGHENIAAVIHASEEDICFLESNGLANRKDAYVPKNNYFDAYDEKLDTV